LIPAAASDVTPEWMTDVLRSSGALASGTVRGFTRDRIGEGIGIMGELHRFQIDYDGDAAGAPGAVVVKLPSPFEANRAQGVGLGMYEAEVGFYRDLAASTPVRTPVCHRAEIRPGTADFVVVLEDLSGLEVADQVRGMSLEQAEAATLALATLHAAWWERVGDLEWVPSVVHPRIEAMAGMWPDLWPAFVANFGDRLSPAGLAAGERVRDSYWSLMSALGRRPWTLLHQDFRCDNMFFDAAVDGADGVVVIDWQSIGRGPGAYDLAYLLGGSLTVDDRREHEERLVRAYRERAGELGVAGLGFDELWSDYRMAHLVGTAVPVLTGATFDLANERGGALIGTLSERHFAAVVDLDATALIP